MFIFIFYEIINRKFRYPKGLVVKIIKESWAVELRKMIEMEFVQSKEKKSDFYDVLLIPYVENFSGFIQKELKKINVGVVMKINVGVGVVV